MKIAYKNFSFKLSKSLIKMLRGKKPLLKKELKKKALPKKQVFFFLLAQTFSFKL